MQFNALKKTEKRIKVTNIVITKILIQQGSMDKSRTFPFIQKLSEISEDMEEAIDGYNKQVEERFYPKGYRTPNLEPFFKYLEGKPKLRKTPPGLPNN